MPRVFQGNFGFESELADPSKSANTILLRRNAELAHLWIAIANESDRIPLPNGIDADLIASLETAGLPLPRIIRDLGGVPKIFEYTPWGWSAPAVELAMRAGLPIRHPPLPVVRRINSRRFSLELETEWDCGIAGSRLVQSLENFQAALAGNPLASQRWIAKAEFGMAGRERIMGQGASPPTAALNWVAKRLKLQQAIVFEPCVSIIAEAGAQLDIPRTGRPRLLGITPFLAARTGEFRGCRFDEDAEIEREWSGALSIIARSAERMQSLGYFGPLGIDAAKYVDDNGTEHIRPLQDINARFSMGRLALGFRRLLKPSEAAVWLHQRWSTDSPRQSFEQLAATLPPGGRVVRTSPFVVAEKPVAHGTLICTADDASRLKDVMSF